MIADLLQCVMSKHVLMSTEQAILSNCIADAIHKLHNAGILPAIYELSEGPALFCIADMARMRYAMTHT